MTISEVSRQAPRPGKLVVEREPKRSPIRTWATIGAIAVTVELYVLIAWFASGDAKASPAGTDPLPSSTHSWLLFFQITSGMAAVAAVVHAVRSTRREGRLSFDAMLLLGWLSVWWQDPIANYIRPTIFYNGHMFNLGSWTERIPGWVSPNGARYPEPFLFSGSVYFWMMFASIGGCWAMRRAKERWPQLRPIGIVIAGFAMVAILDLALELTFVRTGVYAYPGVIHDLSVWAGRTYQFPVYEVLLWGCVWTATSALRYFRDDGGRSVVERGEEALKVSPRRRNVLRALAVCGFFNCTYLTYNVGMNWIALHVDETPEFPSYLRNGMCGPGTYYECPGPGVPVPLPGSPTGTLVPPYDTD